MRTMKKNAFINIIGTLCPCYIPGSYLYVPAVDPTPVSPDLLFVRPTPK